MAHDPRERPETTLERRAVVAALLEDRGDMLVVAGLGYQAGAPGWVYASAAAGAAATAGAWHRLEQQAVRWMPDKDFPNWMLTNMSAGQANRKKNS